MEIAASEMQTIWRMICPIIKINIVFIPIYVNCFLLLKIMLQ